MVSVVEREGSPDLDRSVRGDTADYKYNIFDTTDEATAHAAMIAAAASTVTSVSGKTLVPTSQRITGQVDGYWQGHVRYEELARKRPEPPETDDTKVTFSIGGQSKHVDKSLDTIISCTVDEDKTPPDFKNAIGVTKDGVEGVDILLPEFTFQITKYVPLATITNSWIQSVADLVGTVADDTFKGFTTGEVLLTSVSGSERSETDAEIIYQFARAKNETIMLAGLKWYDDETDPENPEWTEEIPKLGWEHFWIFFEEQKDETAKRVRKIPKFAYVEQVYEYGDFTFLDLE